MGEALTLWYADRAWLGSERVAAGVVVETDGPRIARVEAGVAEVPASAFRLPGLVIPGLANAHSHAFHRALRARTHAGTADFWAWRERMYEVAARLDPDSYYRLARATYAEMALAGVTTVGEFHYLHHGPGGARYADPNAMGHALAAAAQDAGVRLTLVDACYLHADVDGSPLRGVQTRYGDGSVDAWAARMAEARAPRVAAAIHSVRALRPREMADVAAWAGERGVPLHLHLSEQRQENDACLAAYGVTPARLVADAGGLGRRTVAVHATHLDDAAVSLLGGSGTTVCLCPTTERDLADGVGQARRLADAGSPLCLGSDSHAVIDMFEEARAVELDERLVTGERGLHRPADLLRAATEAGAYGLGWPDAGRIAVGSLADLVAVRLDSPRLAGTWDEDPLAAVVYAASAADVSHVIVGGEVVVADGVHQRVEDVPGALDAAVRAVLG